ncbi:MAG: aspartate dehydrogenase [Chloroflexi bacterium]|nr:aspartate dehydrogenase [Chloroflexota bacterium]
MTLRVGLIGFGTIGRVVGEAIRDGQAGHCELVGVLVRHPERLAGVSAGFAGVAFTSQAEAFLAQRPALVVEAAGQPALKQYTEQVLRAGADLFVLAVGAFTDQSFFDRVVALADQLGRRVILGSGGIAGIDWISSAAVGRLDRVTYTQRKPPHAWRHTPAEQQHPNIEQVTEPLLIFEGVARDSARLFPENTNISALGGLAGIGLDRTTVKLYADPTIPANVNEVTVEGELGTLRFEVRNAPSENPKTSRIIAPSVIKALRHLSGPLWVGA